MALTQAFIPAEIGEIETLAQKCKESGMRFVQILAVNTEQGIDLIYSFIEPFSEQTKNAEMVNYKVSGVTKDDAIPSISDLFLEAFVFENEIHDLFGVSIEGIAIDFQGSFYALKQNEPMTIISPAQLEAREKARKIAAAKAAKAAKATKAEKAKDAQAPLKASAEDVPIAGQATEKGGE